MDPEQIHKLDEATTDISKHLIPTLWSFYKSCMDEGFRECQALELTKTWMSLLFKKNTEGD